ncbi:DUF2158 domain-containing protein [Agrobacterium leguminum]|uniref:YodC family protein n=1 Tax=Agrobacterium leguminum TaxID=2792015 RepID=UPI0022B817B8|nr:DUF2158 domain-containing protein [Agrobacterium leguminum]MCZ7930926.1 DUF2158 domain-containing protein [Agrobacterium leguminum]
MQEFEIGDVVQLKSGGPLMTINHLNSTGNYTCVWFNTDGHTHSLQNGVFKAETLRKKD